MKLERGVAWITGGLKATVEHRFTPGAMGRFGGFSDEQAMFQVYLRKDTLNAEWTVTWQRG